MLQYIINTTAIWSLSLLCFTKYDIDYQVQRNDVTYNRTPSPYTPQENRYEHTPTAQDKASAHTYAQQDPQDRARYRAAIPAGDHYLHGNGNAILLAGMENNAIAKCCSANLLWGSDHTKNNLTEGYPEYAPVYLSMNIANPCTQVDPYRKEQYERAIERYSHVLDTWNEYAGDVSIGLGTSSPELAAQFVIADDPWSLNADRRTPTTPVLSIDRSIFGQSTRTIFDGTTAMAKQTREKSVIVHTKNISFNP